MSGYGNNEGPGEEQPPLAECPRCGAESNGVTIVLTSPWRKPSREYACQKCLLRKRHWRTGELGEPEPRGAAHFEQHLCERCGRKMLRMDELVRGDKTLMADRFCRACVEIAPRERAAERARLSRQAKRNASGTPSWMCQGCEKEITGRVFSAWWRGYFCEDCYRVARVKENRSAWDRSVEEGRPGKNYFGRDLVNPDDFTPNLDTETCEVCQREVNFAYSMTERREIHWCRHDACYAGAVRLAKRLDPVEPRPCERCGEMHSRKRGARYCSDLCRALASRERRASESGGR